MPILTQDRELVQSQGARADAEDARSLWRGHHGHARAAAQCAGAARKSTAHSATCRRPAPIRSRCERSGSLRQQDHPGGTRPGGGNRAAGARPIASTRLPKRVARRSSFCPSMQEYRKAPEVTRGACISRPCRSVLAPMNKIILDDTTRPQCRALSAAAGSDRRIPRRGAGGDRAARISASDCPPAASNEPYRSSHWPLVAITARGARPLDLLHHQSDGTGDRAAIRRAVAVETEPGLHIEDSVCADGRIYRQAPAAGRGARRRK